RSGTTDAALFHPRQTDSEPPLLVRPGFLRNKSRDSQNRLGLPGSILVAVLCMYRLARAEIHPRINSRQPYGLFFATHKMHLDAGFRRIPYRAVSKSLETEVRIEFAV